MIISIKICVIFQIIFLPLSLIIGKINIKVNITKYILLNANKTETTYADMTYSYD